MGEILTNPGLLVIALIVSGAMIMVFYQDIKTYIVDKGMIAWKQSKGYLGDEQAVAERQKAKKALIRKLLFGAIFYYVAIVGIIISIGIAFLFILAFCGIFAYRSPRWHPWNP